MDFELDSLPGVEYDENERAIPVTDAERGLLAAARAGEKLEVAPGNDVSDPGAWEREQVLRGAFLRHLCLHSGRYGIDPQGIQVDGVLVAGELNLEFAEMKIPLRVFRSRFTYVPQMEQATLPLLDLSESHLPGLAANRLTVAGSVFLRGVTVKGETQLLGVAITGNLDCDNAAFDNSDGFAFNAQRMKVKGSLFWRGFTPERRPKGRVDLRHAQVGNFADDGTGWPETGRLWADGFRYENLVVPTSAAERLRWLALSPETWMDGKPAYWPQPYEQLVQVFRNAGHEHDARHIAVAKQDAYVAYLKRKQDAGMGANRRRRLLLRFLKLTACYGYAPWRALGWAALLIGMAWMMFSNAFDYGFMAPAKERVVMHECYIGTVSSCKGWKSYQPRFVEADNIRVPADYPKFNAFFYAVGTFVPIVDLHQETYWIPSREGWLWGGLFKVYLWLHIAAGWVLTTIFVAGFTGLIKKD